MRKIFGRAWSPRFSKLTESKRSGLVIGGRCQPTVALPAGVIILLAALLGPAIAAGQEEPNFLLNSSFELWPEEPGGDPDGWGRVFGVGLVEKSDEIRRSGLASVKYTRTEGNVNGYQEIPGFRDLIAVTCSAWALAEKPNTVRLVIADDRAASVSPWATDVNNWVRLGVTHTLREEATQLRVILDVSGAGSADLQYGTVGYFDDVACFTVDVRASPRPD